MKKFLSEYGFTIIAAIAIITLVVFSSPIGNTIKRETSNLIDSFGVVSETKMEQLDNSLWETEKSDLAIQILGHTQYLYDVGEANLTDADIVRIGEVEFYVLEVSPDNSKAKLITKDIYDVRFDMGNNNPEDVEGHISQVINWSNTYDYKYSSLRKWMKQFYIEILREDSRIIPSDINYYTKDTWSTNPDDYDKKTLTGEYAFPIDAKEAVDKSDKFSFYWDGNYFSIRKVYTTAGSIITDKHCRILTVDYVGTLGSEYAHSVAVGTRPVFWISLE